MGHLRAGPNLYLFFGDTNRNLTFKIHDGFKMKSDGYRGLTWREKRQLDFFAWLRRWLVSDVEVSDRSYKSFFVCENRLQAYRAVSLWQKEEGTMEWIDSGVRPGDRFLDIGANVGIYTIAAAHRVGPTGKVYAFEPHKPNAVSLMKNVLRNNFEGRVDILSLPLSKAPIVAPFHYTSLEPSVTGSQFGSTFVDGQSDQSFMPAATELCLGSSIDDLLASHVIEPPHLVKIDVDGIEIDILEGMRHLLMSDARPRSVQVELNLGEQELIVELMAECHYKLDHRHFTANGAKRRARGDDLSTIPHNAVFVPA